MYADNLLFLLIHNKAKKASECSSFSALENVASMMSSHVIPEYSCIIEYFSASLRIV
jgi:hypothetical protein